MTNRQSNIIFYSVIALFVCGLIVNHFNPEFFEDLSKSKEELSIQEATTQGEYNKALSIYQTLLDKSISGNEITIQAADMHEEMAKLHARLANKTEEKEHYLKSLAIKKQLTKINVYNLADTYFKLGAIAEEEQQLDKAQQYYEQALSTRVGNTNPDDAKGIFDGLQRTQQQYKRLNNAGTIDIFKKLGALHSSKKEYTTAKDYYERALAASKLTFGDDDSRTLETLSLIQQLAI